MPPRLPFPAASENPSNNTAPDVLIKRKCYGDLSVAQQPATLFPNFSPGLHKSRASPLSRSPADRQGPSVQTPARASSMASPEQRLVVARSPVAIGSMQTGASPPDRLPCEGKSDPDSGVCFWELESCGQTLHSPAPTLCGTSSWIRQLGLGGRWLPCLGG